VVYLGKICAFLAFWQLLLSNLPHMELCTESVVHWWKPQIYKNLVVFYTAVLEKLIVVFAY